MGAGAPDRLAEITAAQGEAATVGGNRPIQLTDPDTVWYVVRGALDVFVAERSGDGMASDFKQMLRAGPGRMVFGIEGPNGGALAAYIAKGLPDTEIRRVPLAAFAESQAADLLVPQVDAWISDFASTIAREIVPRPRPERAVAAGETLDVDERVLTTRRGVVWVSSAEGHAAFLDSGESLDGQVDCIPVTGDSWIRLYQPDRLTVTTSAALLAEDRLFAALADFHRMALAADQLSRRLTLVDLANLQRAQAQRRRQSEQRARQRLFGVLDRRTVGDGGPALLTALRMVGAHEGIRFRAPPRREGPDDGDEGGAALADVQRVSGVRARTVTLAGDDGWWRHDSGALLAFRRADGQPVALIPGVTGRYRMVDADTGRAQRVDARRARELAPDAYFFYRPLPPTEPVRSGTLLRFALRGLGRDVARVALAGTLVGVLMLTPPILLGLLVDRVIPSGSPWMLLQASLALVLAAVLAASLQMLQGTGLMRLEALAAARVGAAIWDRLLGLPRPFFRRFAAGDLTLRAMAFQGLRDQVSGVVGNALLSVIFLLPTFLLLFVYDTGVGWLGLALGLCSLAVTVTIGTLQLPHHRRLLTTSRRVAATLLQLLNGIGKLRSTGSEGIGFAVWAADYRAQKETEMRLGILGEHVIAFVTAAPLLAAAALFAFTLRGPGDPLPTGTFLTIYAAFMVFFAAVSRLGATFSALAAIMPAYQQTKPILEATSDNSPEGEQPPALSGDVRLEHVSFRYTEDGPPVLRDVSVHARAGEFVAIVGESGAGKSTLFRLALGLENPLSGAVYYDGRDLARLNRRAVRSAIGMVGQDASLRPGTVLENIVGVFPHLTEDDAWRAARLAAIDEDIAAMPMQMQTITGDNSSMFSGGQIQRIMLAAALVRDPSVLFLDEATNWLDNKSQAQVMDSVAGLAVTRFVSAHRLSTIRKADRVYVLEGGRVAQTGTFDELMATEGLFRALVRRQMA